MHDKGLPFAPPNPPQSKPPYFTLLIFCWSIFQHTLYAAQILPLKFSHSNFPAQIFLLKFYQFCQNFIFKFSDEEEKVPVTKDFIDIYLEKVEGTKDENSSFYGSQGLANLQRSLTDLFGAGSETSSSVLLFAFLYMIKYPNVQVG